MNSDGRAVTACLSDPNQTNRGGAEMTTNHKPKHRDNNAKERALAVAHTPRHRADPLIERLGAEAPEIRQLFHDITRRNR